MALIIDANMPACCGGCFFLDYDTNERPRCFLCGADITEYVREQTKHPICPIIGEIPDSHGDLVDVQAIEERAKEIQYERGITYKEALLLAFDEASVVVEATE